MKTLLLITISLLAAGLINGQHQLPAGSYEVSTTMAVRMGLSTPVGELTDVGITDDVKKQSQKKKKRVSENFKGRRGKSKAIYADKEHQGEDPLWQKSITKQRRTGLESIVNINGISDQGSPHDPSGDIGPNHYVQMVNATLVAVYDLEGNLVQQFAANTLWTEFGGVSVGDPIVLYDDDADRWVLTEFSDPANVFIAISEDTDPLGSYTVYNFSTPEFPDYPKYAITPDALVFTSNEGGAGTLHQYFIERAALLAGDPTARMQRVEISGNNDTEAGFYVSTPVDWNGANMPYDSKPIVLTLNDSSWDGGPEQDQVEVYTFDIDFDDQTNTTVSQSSIVTTPFDSYPCSESGFGFQCTPQLGGGGLDALPELITNIPHLRNFGTHESMVFSFVTDATDGQNLSAIRWMELRRTSESDWAIYQEGTFAPDDGLDRYMSSIAMDDFGNIAMGYVTSSSETYADVRVTGRYNGDELGVMTIEEVVVAEGVSTIQSFGRFGDYSQMSVSPDGDNTFWFTTEYGGGNTLGAATRIVAVQLQKDTFDMQAVAVVEPTSASDLTASEVVTVTVRNQGLSPIDSYTVGYMLDGVEQETVAVTELLAADEVAEVTFTTTVDLSAKVSYEIQAYVTASMDTNSANDTTVAIVENFRELDAAVSIAESAEDICSTEAEVTVQIKNLGLESISNVAVEIELNGTAVDTITDTFDIMTADQGQLSTTVTDLQAGDNIINATILTVNEMTDQLLSNNTASTTIFVDENLESFSIIFLADEYPEETDFRLIETESGTLLAEGGLTTESSEEVFSFCGATGTCYTLVVTDAVGDGMCCGFGEGNFRVIDAQGSTLVANDGDFGQSAIEAFCLGDIVCNLTTAIGVEDATGSTAADGTILMEVSNGVSPYQYSKDGGQSYQDAPLFAGLLPGDYVMVAADVDSNCTTIDTVTVGFTTSTDDLLDGHMTISALPNPTDGVFVVEVSGLPAADHFVYIHLIDTNGKLVQTRKIGRYDGVHTATVSLLAYPAGIYYLKVDHPSASLLQKVIRM